MEEENPFEKKCCYDCAFLKAYVSWWCKNQEAIEARGTAIPGVRNCSYWKPDWDYITKEYKTEENGYKEKQSIFVYAANLFRSFLKR